MACFIDHPLPLNDIAGFGTGVGEFPALEVEVFGTADDRILSLVLSEK